MHLPLFSFKSMTSFLYLLLHAHIRAHTHTQPSQPAYFIQYFLYAYNPRNDHLTLDKQWGRDSSLGRQFLPLSVFLGLEKYSSHPVSKKLLSVKDGDHSRNPQPIKVWRIRDCVVPSPS